MDNKHCNNGVNDFWLIVFPLTIISFLLYFVFSHNKNTEIFYYVALHLPLSSGIILKPTWGDLFILLTLFIFFIDVSTPKYFSSIERGWIRLTSIISITIIAFIFFLNYRWAANSLFFILLIMMLMSSFVWTVAVRKENKLNKTTIGQLYNITAFLLTKIPLTTIPFFIYLILISTGKNAEEMYYVIFKLPLPSGAVLRPTQGDLYIIFSLILFFIDISFVKHISGKLIENIGFFISMASLIISYFLFENYSWAGNMLFIELSFMLCMSTLVWGVFMVKEILH